MKKAKKVLVTVMAIISAAAVLGCGQTGNQPEIQNNMAGGSAEGETEMGYDEKSMELLKEILGCEQKNAESILRSLGRQGIGSFLEAEQVDTSDGYAVKIKTEAEQEYILYIDKTYHLFAIQKDSRQGEYIYRELE